MSFSLQIEDQGLIEFSLSVILDPFDFNWFMFCPWAMSFFQKLCPAPFPPISYFFPGPLSGPLFCLYNLLEGQPENSWPLAGKYCIILALPAVWAQTLTTFLLKLQAYPQIKSPLHFYEHLVRCPLTNLFLGHLLPPTTRTLPPCRQCCSTPVKIKYS